MKSLLLKIIGSILLGKKIDFLFVKIPDLSCSI